MNPIWILSSILVVILTALTVTDIDLVGSFSSSDYNPVKQIKGVFVNSNLINNSMNNIKNNTSVYLNEEIITIPFIDKEINFKTDSIQDNFKDETVKFLGESKGVIEDKLFNYDLPDDFYFYCFLVLILGLLFFILSKLNISIIKPMIILLVAFILYILWRIVF